MVHGLHALPENGVGSFSGSQTQIIFPALTNFFVQFPNSLRIKSFFHMFLPGDQQHCNPMQLRQGHLAHKETHPP